MVGNILGNKSNIYEKDWSKSDRQNFILDYFCVDCDDLLKIDGPNADNSTKIYLDKINNLLGTYAPLRRIDKYKLKFKSKPWITLGLWKSLSVKNKLLTNFINKKDYLLKEEFHTKYKKYTNLLSTLMMFWIPLIITLPLYVFFILRNMLLRNIRVKRQKAKKKKKKNKKYSEADI